MSSEKLLPCDKPPFSVVEQFKKLESYGLSFRCSESEVYQFFLTNNFYRFKGYVLSFQKDSKDLSALYFEDIIELYDFDHKLRLLIFDAISQIEIALRAQIIYRHALKYGSSWHLMPCLFNKEPIKTRSGYEDPFKNFKQALFDEVSRSGDQFILTYKCYDNFFSILPCWISLEVLSFGSLSKKLYSNLKDDDGGCKREIAKFFNLSPTILESWLNHISVVRNVCAHHGRLWNRKLPLITADSKH